MATQASYQAAAERVRAQVEKYAIDLWGWLPSYRDRDIARFVDLLTPRVLAGQVQIANLTAAYMRDQTGLFVPVDTSHVTGGRGVNVAEVYRRPAVTTYTALSDGKTFTASIAAGGARLASLVAMDMQMAKVRQAQRSLEGSTAGGFKRVLTGRENCALCMIASTQRYHKGDLLPIHPGCDCGVEPLPPGADLDDQVLDSDLLERVHAEVEARAGLVDRGGREPDYRKLTLVREHGEYGPTLTWASDHFTSADDLPMALT